VFTVGNRGDGAAARVPQALSLQYVSLMLIILTFVIGAFERTPSAPETPVLVEEAPAPEPAGLGTGPSPSAWSSPRGALDTLTIERLFEPGGREVNRHRGEAIATLLRSHDLLSEIEVRADVFEGQGESIGLALRRGRTLAAWLSARGVPAEAVRIHVYDSIHPLWATRGAAPGSVVMRLFSVGEAG